MFHFVLKLSDNDVPYKTPHICSIKVSKLRAKTKGEAAYTGIKAIKLFSFFINIHTVQFYFFCQVLLNGISVRYKNCLCP